MSLVPMLFSDWWEDLEHPHSILDQHFGLPLEPENLLLHRPNTQALQSSSSSSLSSANRHIDHLGYPLIRRMRRQRYHPFHQAALLRRTAGKVATLYQNDKDKFLVTLDVQQFAPDELNVKVVDRNVIIEAKHEEKEDEHGWISRQFTRKYFVPVYADIEAVESFLSSDGVLTITAPRKKAANAENNERLIKIQFTGEPAVIEHHDNQTKTVDGLKDDSTREIAQQRYQIGQRGKKVTVKGA